MNRCPHIYGLALPKFKCLDHDFLSEMAAVHQAQETIQAEKKLSDQSKDLHLLNKSKYLKFYQLCYLRQNYKYCSILHLWIHQSV